MRNLLLLSVLLVISGCNTSSVQWVSDANVPYLLKGQAAVEMASVLAKNALTVEGRKSELQKYNAWLYAGLVLAFVAGVAFWGFTRSRYGFVIPGASIAGIVFITFWVEYSQWITLGVLIVALALLVWKAIEYQKERNAESQKNKG